MERLPPQQQRMYDLLKDGLPHSLQELHGCLHDELGAMVNAQVAISFLRRRIRPVGLEVVCQRNNGAQPTYRLVRVIQGEKPTQLDSIND